MASNDVYSRIAEMFEFPGSKNLIKYPFLFLKKMIRIKDSQKTDKAEFEQHLYVFSYGELKNLLKKGVKFSDLGAIKINMAIKELESLSKKFSTKPDIEMSIIEYMKENLDKNFNEMDKLCFWRS